MPAGAALDFSLNTNAVWMCVFLTERVADNSDLCDFLDDEAPFTEGEIFWHLSHFREDSALVFV